MKNEHRFHLALRGPSAVRMSRMVRVALAKLSPPREVRITVDVDALHLL